MSGFKSVIFKPGKVKPGKLINSRNSMGIFIHFINICFLLVMPSSKIIYQVETVNKIFLK